MGRLLHGPRFTVPAFLLTLGLTATTASAQAPSTLGTRPTSVADAVAVALRQNPDALTSDAVVRGAEADRAGVTGGFGPKVHVDANATQWNSPFNILFGPQNFEVRDAFTWT